MEGESMARGNHSFTGGDIRRRFGAIVGHTVAEVDTAGVLAASSASRNKGRIGAIIEQSVLGYPADSDRRPDIVIDGALELSLTPFPEPRPIDLGLSCFLPLLYRLQMPFNVFPC